MAAESLTAVRTRIGLQIAAIETRATRLKPVDIGARMAAIRTMAAEHGLVARSDSRAGALSRRCAHSASSSTTSSTPARATASCA